MQGTGNLRGHPIEFLRGLERLYGSAIQLSFSRYKYIRRSRTDARISFSVGLSDVTRSWLSKQLAALDSDEELALESRARYRGKHKHIPMLDFIGASRGQLSAVLEVLPEFRSRAPYVYFSGRSFHAYFPALITKDEWVRFMGSALLCNTPSRPRNVDQRWIGHRLIGGYSALRWSFNTRAYKAMPVRVGPRTLMFPRRG